MSVSFVIANELVEAARDDGLRNDELAAVLVAVVVLVTAAKSTVDRAEASSRSSERRRVRLLAEKAVGEGGGGGGSGGDVGVGSGVGSGGGVGDGGGGGGGGGGDVSAFVDSAIANADSRKGLLAFLSELLGIAARISLSVTIQVLAVSVSATGSSRLLRVGTLLSVVFFFLFFESAFVRRKV